VRYRPFTSPIGQINADELVKLCDPDEPVLEGLFIEYKRDWTSKKVARAAAAFANSDGGGSIVVGIEANELRPVRIVGIEDAGGLDERVANAIRSQVAPIPSFRSQSVDIGDGKACIVIEVPAGLQPPYIFRPSGQVLIRTQISSEAIPLHDRETLDRLYRAGARGEEWGRGRAADYVAGLGYDRRFPEIVVFPNVGGGLDGHSRVFKKSTVDRLAELNRHPQAPDAQYSTHGSKLLVNTESVTDISAFFAQSYQTSLSESVTLTFRLLYEDLLMGPEALENLASDRLPIAQSLLEEVFDYRGTVSLGVHVGWSLRNGGTEVLNFPIYDISVEQLSGIELVQRIHREINRARGVPMWEPEGTSES
jgi:hypothetical protein